MRIDIELCERTDVNPEFLFLRNKVAQFLIQPVDSLKHENIPGGKPQQVAPVILSALREIVPGKFNLLSMQQRRHLFLEKFKIERLEALKVIISVRIFRHFGPLFVIIVKTDRMGLPAVCRQLDRQSP